MVRPRSRRFLTAALAAAVFYSGMSYLASAHSSGEANDASEAGYTFVSSGHFEDAIGIYSRQIAAEPKNYVLYLRRALSLIRLQRYDDALSDLGTAAQLSPNRATAADLGEKRWQSSERKTHAWLLDMQIHMTRADVLQRLNRNDEALADLDYAVTLNPDDVSNRHERGIARTLTGRYDDAIADFDFVLGKRMVVESLFARGIAKFLKEDWQNAVADFRDAAQRLPNNPKVAGWLKRAEEKSRPPGVWVMDTAPHADFSQASYRVAAAN